MTKVERFQNTPEARKELFQFYEEVYPNSPWLLDDSRFEWQNLQNPHHKNGETQVWLLRDEQGQIIGQNIYILYELSIDGRIYPGNCSTNLVVRPELVGKRLGHKLIDVNEGLGGIAYAVGITPASTRAFVKRGWVLIEDARLYSAIINPKPNLKYLGWPKWKTVLASPILRTLSLCYSLFGKLTVPRRIDGLSVREIDSFEPGMDKYWREFLKGYAIHFVRSSNMLNFKFCTRTDVNHHILLFERNGHPVGYGVYRLSENKVKGIRLGRIVDLVYDPLGGHTLVEYIVKTLKSKLLSLVVDGIVGIASDATMARAMKKNGMYLSRVQPAIIKEGNFSISKLRKKYCNIWYMTLADSDLDNYW